MDRESEKRRRKKILRLHRAVCYYCGRPGADEVDHVIPIAEGGTDDDSNLAPIHGRPCHQRKTQDEAQRARRRRKAQRGGVAG